MGKKKRTENAVVQRNPEDFLNDLKFIRKNRDNKPNEDNPANAEDNTDQKWKADHDNVPAFFKSVQKLVKTKKIEKESKLIEKDDNKRIGNDKGEVDEKQERWAF